MADPVRPSDDAVAAARYLRMVGATRRRRRPVPAETEPPIVEIEPIDPIEADDAIDYAEAFRQGPQGMGPDSPEVVIDEGEDDTWSDALRDSYGAELEREARDRTIRNTGLVPIRDEIDRAELEREATEENVRRRNARAESGRRHLMRNAMAFDDPRVPETFMDEEELERFRDPNRERPSMLTSAVRGFAQGVAGGGADEAIGSIEAAFTDETAPVARERWEQAYEDAELENPTSYDLGQALSLVPSLLSRGGIQGRIGDWIGAAPTRGGRVLRSGIAGAGLGGYSGVMSSDEPLLSNETLDRGAGGALVGGGMGLGLAGIGEGVDSLVRRAPSTAQRLDEYAAPIRVRSAGVRSLPQMREMDTLPGGANAVARRLDETGIMPRGRMLDTIDDATARAEAVQQRGAQAIQGTFDDAAAARAAETGARGVSDLGTVDLEPVASVLDEVAAHYSRVPGAQDQARIAQQLAAEYRARGRVSLDDAQAIKRFLDTEINWRPTTGISSRLAPIQETLRDVRGSLVRQMDSSVERLGPEALQRYQRGRQDYQIGRQFSALGRDSELRDAVNRKLSLTDYLLAGGVGATAGAAGGTGGSLLGAGLAVGANRYLRPREDAIVSGAAERLADALRWVGAREPRFAAMARSLTEAASRSPEALGLALRVLQRNDPEQFQALDAAIRDAPEDDIDPWADDGESEQQIDPWAD